VVSWVESGVAPWGYIPESYLAKTRYGIHTCTVDDAFPQEAYSCTLTGLTNGMHYSVTVRALYIPNPNTGRVRQTHSSVRVRFTLGA
jgi:hypothetical protein